MQLHEVPPGAAERGIPPEQLGVDQVDAADVERRRHPYLSAEVMEPRDEVEARLAVVEAAVDMGADDGDEPRRTERAAIGDEQVHGEGRGLAMDAGEQRPVGVVEIHASPSRIAGCAGGAATSIAAPREQGAGGA